MTLLCVHYFEKCMTLMPPFILQYFLSEGLLIEMGVSAQKIDNFGLNINTGMTADSSQTK